MKYDTRSLVEQYFTKYDDIYRDNNNYRYTPVISTDNYVELGQLTALRFLEWVCRNPGGVIALPTGKTPEFFIKWVQYYLNNWQNEMNKGILRTIGFDANWKPDMASLTFFQLDEFFPIDPDHERSFNYFVRKYYIEGFGLDPQKTHLIDTFHFTEEQRKWMEAHENLDDIFPEGHIDLSLRFKKPVHEKDILRQKAIKLYDHFCDEYEQKIREKGGIGFFLGGIGPDGHIAFNVKGSSFYSTTRLTRINYETEAAAASDLGGIESVRKKAVITMGLETITYNPDNVAIIIAAGQTKSAIIADAVENQKNQEYPATCLQKLPHARFYITRSADRQLSKSEDTILHQIKSRELPANYTDKLIVEGALKHHFSLMEVARSPKENLPLDERWRIAENISQQSIDELAEKLHADITAKIQKGISIPEQQRFLHTAPHHDDIELAYFPLLHHLVRSKHNENYFVYCTSGFTSVTNQYLSQRLNELLHFIKTGKIHQIPKQQSLFEIQYAQDDITGYLNGIASQNKEKQAFYISSRMARDVSNYLETTDIGDIQIFIQEQLDLLRNISPGRKEPESIHYLKGWLREFEAELVWAHFGIDMDSVTHLRLHFYSDEIFPEYPDYELDVLPLYKKMEEIQPTIITLALDPEGSGPDTHFKTLIALSQAIEKYIKNHPDQELKIWGYRNVWSRFDLSETNIIFPVSLNSFAVLHNMFNSCFLSQRSASFPSFELEGTFSELAQKIWVEQYEKLTNLLGKDYFYGGENPLLKRSFGAIFLKEMSYQQFAEHIKMIQRLLEVKDALRG